MKEMLPITPSPSGLAPSSGPNESDKSSGFNDFLSGLVEEVQRTQVQADQAVTDLNSGKARNLHEVMIAMEEADISMRLMVQVRNKAVEAYQEVMRMQV